MYWGKHEQMKIYHQYGHQNEFSAWMWKSTNSQDMSFLKHVCVNDISEPKYVMMSIIYQ